MYFLRIVLYMLCADHGFPVIFLYFACFLRIAVSLLSIFVPQVPRSVALEGEMSTGAHRITS